MSKVEDVQIDGPDEAPQAPNPVIDDLRMPEDSSPSRWYGFLAFVSHHRTRLIIAAGFVLIMPTAGWAFYSHNRPTDGVSVIEHITRKIKKPRTAPSPLTGVAVAPEVAAKPIVGVVIENLNPDARPQSGLSEAGVVYEALAEGGITRFLAFFLDNRPPSIGPVRSLRTYFVDWSLEFNSPVAHAGGNADALDQVGPLNLKDINALNGGPSQYFFRTTDRYAPHNLYTTGAKLDGALAADGYTKPTSFAVSPRKIDAPTASPAHGDINIDYSYNGYQVEYKYNQACNCYDRFLGGAPHVDRNSDKQIQVKNVVVEYMPTSYGYTRLPGEQTVMMSTPGTGKAIVFRDGGAVEGTWGKSGHADRTKLLDAAGKEIPLNKGSTWYAIVPTTKTVTY